MLPPRWEGNLGPNSSGSQAYRQLPPDVCYLSPYSLSQDWALICELSQHTSMVPVLKNPAGYVPGWCKAQPRKDNEPNAYSEIKCDSEMGSSLGSSFAASSQNNCWIPHNLLSSLLCCELECTLLFLSFLFSFKKNLFLHFLYHISHIQRWCPADKEAFLASQLIITIVFLLQGNIIADFFWIVPGMWILKKAIPHSESTVSASCWQFFIILLSYAVWQFN